MKNTLAFMIGFIFSSSAFSAVVHCNFVKGEDLGKKEKMPKHLVISKLTPEIFQYTFTSTNGKKLVKCRIPKSKAGSPLDKNYPQYEHYSLDSDELHECMDGYLDLKSKAEKKKNWELVLLSNSDGTGIYRCN